MPRKNNFKNPAAIQDFLNHIPFNFTETLLSPDQVIKKNKCHCFEGAVLGASLLAKIGHRPLLVCLFAKRPDYDHVIAPFQINGLWGALSKTNHAVLRYREPVYKSIRELVMSYFHEYFLSSGAKTMYAYSGPLNIKNMMDDMWGIDEKLDKIKKYFILSKKIKLRKADNIERKIGKFVEFKK